MADTKITEANVRVMISHNYSNFEIAMKLENPNGIEKGEINNARESCQSLAMDAVNQYRIQAIPNQKEEIKKLGNTLEALKKLSDQSKADIKEEQIDPEEIAKVENMPLYKPAPKADKAPAKQTSAKGASKTGGKK